MKNTETRIIPALGRRFFVPPYLARTPIAFAALLIVTDCMLVLMRQPAAYWLNYSRAEIGNAWVQQILTAHPLLFVGLIGVYLLLVGLLLDGLSFSPAFVLWIFICFIHSENVVSVALCVLSKYVYLDPLAISLIRFGGAVLFLGVLGTVVVKTYFAPRTAATETAALVVSSKPGRFHRIFAGAALSWLVLLAVGLFFAMREPVAAWRPIIAARMPGPRFHAAAAYDLHRNRLVLFGGQSMWLGDDRWKYESETWEWDGENWHWVISEVAPYARASTEMAYDEHRQVVVMFGGANDGYYFGDTWEWDGHIWSLVSTPVAPTRRGSHKMLYDPHRQAVVLYGGYDGTTYYNDAWEWDGQTWSPIALEYSPPANYFSMFYDSQLDQIVVSLGWDTTWYWRDAVWTRGLLVSEPQVAYAPMAYDWNRQRAVLFGGHDQEYSADTWVFENDAWHKLELAVSPPMRLGHISFYDPNRNRVIIYGGYRDVDGTVFSDMWELVVPDN